MKRLGVISVSILLWTLLIGTTALGNILECPPYVIVEEDGSFSFEVVFTACALGADPATALIRNGGNTDLGEILIDYGCTLHLGPGEQVHIPVAGHLLDLRFSGLVVVRFSLCTGQEFTDQTYVLPYGTVPAEQDTWGRIKAIYR